MLIEITFHESILIIGKKFTHEWYLWGTMNRNNNITIMLTCFTLKLKLTV